MAAARSLNASQEMLGRSLTRLSSGSKIVNPSDDAAGLAVSEKMDAQNRRVKAATTNVQNAVSYIQTADGFMSGMTKILSRMSELAILAKDVTKNATDVDLYAAGIHALQDQLRATIGGSTLSSAARPISPRRSEHSTASRCSVPTPRRPHRDHWPGGRSGHDDSRIQSARRSDGCSHHPGRQWSLRARHGHTGLIGNITDAIQQVATERAKLGASQSRLELAATTLSVEYENLHPPSRVFATWMWRRNRPSWRSSTSSCSPAPPCWRRPTRVRSRSSSCCKANSGRSSRSQKRAGQKPALFLFAVSRRRVQRFDPNRRLVDASN